MTTPSDYPEFATQSITLPNGSQNKIPLPEALKSIGYDVDQVPHPQHFNWLFNNVGLWIKDLNERVGNLAGSSFDTIEDLLLAGTPLGFDIAIVKGYHAVGDGGGGPTRLWISGEDPGTFVSNGGNILVPYGGNGSSAWVFPVSEGINALEFGAKGDGITDDTSVFTTMAEVGNVIKVPITENSYVVNSNVVNNASTFVFDGGPTQLAGTASAQQLRAIFTNSGYIGGVPIADSLRDGSIGIVAGAIRQNTSDRTRWDFINDSLHEPVGVSGAFATAAGGKITITFDKTYSEVISFIATPDETLSNVLDMTMGASVGLSSAVISASSQRQGAFTLSYDTGVWDFVSGTNQDINPTLETYDNGTLTIAHNYCRGINVNISPYSLNGSVLNPYIPIVKTVSNVSIGIQWIDTQTGNIVTGSASERMKAVVSKVNNGGLYLDGTNDSNSLNLDSGNIWFYGIFKV